MVQPQLVDYVASQVKLGVSRDAIKSALIGAGWMAVDVEDTLKKIEGGAAGSAVSAKPVSSAAASSASASPSASAKGAEPQSVRVSDLIAASGSATSFLSGGSSLAKSKPSSAAKPDDVSMKNDMMKSDAAMPGGRSKKGLIIKIIGIVLIAGLGGGAGFFYYQNMGLSAQIAQLGGESKNVNAQVSSLTSQVQAMTASNTALTSQLSSLTEENQTLLDNLSFAAIPPLASGSSAGTVSIAGVLKNSRSTYELTTAYGVQVIVGNSKDTKVDAALKPLLTSTSSVTLTGTHVPGSQYLTVTAVNGVSLAAAATPSATGTAASSIPASASTTPPAATSSSAGQ